MRTTLTLDSDVAVLLEKKQAAQKVSFKEAVNDALRRGLADELAEVPAAVYSTPTHRLGPARVTNLDRVAEALAVAEQEGFR